MRWFRRRRHIPAEAHELHQRAREAKEYVDREVSAARRREPEVRELSVWQQQRIVQNHLTAIFHTGRGRA